MTQTSKATNGQTANTECERRSPLTEMAVHIAEEQVHDLDPARRRARQRTEEALERSRPKDYRRRNKIGEQFVPYTIRMLESPAYRVLSLSGHRLLARLEIELAHHAGHDNGELVVSYRQFIAYGIHDHAVRPAIRECVTLGFLAVTEQGRAGNREHRSPNKFRLTYRPVGRARATDEWARIRTIGDAEMLVRIARRPAAKPRRAKTFSTGGNRIASTGGNHQRKRRFSLAETASLPAGGNHQHYLDSRVGISPSHISHQVPMVTNSTAMDARAAEVVRVEEVQTATVHPFCTT
jgi:hypothetical protein